MKKSLTLLFSVIFILGFNFPVFAAELELADEKILKEIKKLELESEQIEIAINATKNPSLSSDPSEFEQNMITSTITILASVLTISLTAGYAWYKAKMVIPLSDQEKLFRDLVKKDLNNQYKEKWDIIRDTILKTDEEYAVVEKSTSDNDDELQKAIKELPVDVLDNLTKKKFEQISVHDLPEAILVRMHDDKFKKLSTEKPQEVSETTVVDVLGKISKKELKTYTESELNNLYKTISENLKNDKFEELRRKVLEELQNIELERYWEIISQRKFPKNLYRQIEHDHIENIKNYIEVYNINYLKRKKDEFISDYEKRIKKLALSLTKTLNSEYFEMVAKTLPKLVTVSVTVSKPSKDESDLITKWNSSALQKIKWLMILNGLSEYEKTVKFLIDAEIKTQSKKIDEDDNAEKIVLMTTLLNDLIKSKSITEDVYQKAIGFLTKE